MRIREICVLLMLATMHSIAGAWQLHTFDESVVQLQVADSVVAIQLADIIDSASFARQRPELRDTYVPWNLGDGFHVFGVEPGLDIAAALIQLRADPLVRMANPIIQESPSSVLWMTDLLAVQFRHGTLSAQIDSVNTLLAAYVNSPDPDKPLLYWVRARPDLGLSTLEIADAYYATGLCLYAQPDSYGMCNPTGSIREGRPPSLLRARIQSRQVLTHSIGISGTGPILAPTMPGP